MAAARNELRLAVQMYGHRFGAGENETRTLDHVDRFVVETLAARDGR